MKRHLAWLLVLGGWLASTAEAQIALPKSGTGTYPPPPTPARFDRPPANQPSPTPNVGPDFVLLKALAMNPITAPYLFDAKIQDDRVRLEGRVGTKEIYNAAVRTAVDLGIPFIDRLVIDTAEIYRVAARASVMPGYGGAPPPASPVSIPTPGTAILGGAYGATWPPTYTPFYSPGSAVPYIYPQPLFGRLDEPFFGFEPPITSYPPWWGALSARRLGAPPAAAPPPAAAAPAPGPARTGEPMRLSDTVEMTIDANGVVTLYGTVRTLSDRIALGQELMKVPEITQVNNLLNVVDPNADVQPRSDAQPQADPSEPPVPPEPEVPEAEAEDPLEEEPNDDQANVEPAPVPLPALGDRLLAVPVGAIEANDPRLEQALAQRAELRKLPIQAHWRDGVVTLTGTVPSAFEAMLAFRAVQQTPGVEEIKDRLRFEVPSADRKNPLLNKGSPEDVEAYLTAQIRRQLGDQAHLDRVRLLGGNRLELKGTLRRADDQPRIEAVLRSTPVLRGFELDTRFAALDQKQP